jgi:hypothetical protein
VIVKEQVNKKIEIWKHKRDMDCYPESEDYEIYSEFIMTLESIRQAIPDEVTLREVKEYCIKYKNKKNSKGLDEDCLYCYFGDNDKCWEYEGFHEPYLWDINKITKAVRG